MKNGRSYGGKVVHRVVANPKHPDQHNHFYSTACLPSISFSYAHMTWTDEAVTCKRCLKETEAVRP